jgi:hypothetical protein
MFYNHRTSSTSSSDQQGDEFSNSTVTDIMGFIKEKTKVRISISQHVGVKS